MTLYRDVIGQERAVAQLRAAATAPLHAYLLVGPPGSGKRAAARSFAASLLCPDGGCGADTCRDCALALAEAHPDLTIIDRVGAHITVDQARELSRRAALSPVEGRRKVLVPIDLHLVSDAAPALLKTIEEPSESTVFVILADYVPPELVTIASRCVRVDFRPVPTALVVDVLVAEGLERARAEEVAASAGGRLDRARLLASDPGLAARRSTWQSVPTCLDGTGATAARLADELMELLATAASGPLQARHQAELSELAARVERLGARGSGKRQLEERHKRELRRLRADELRFGLTTMANEYRDRLATTRDPREYLDALAAIDAAAAVLDHNPNEALLLQALLLRLPAGA